MTAEIIIFEGTCGAGKTTLLTHVAHVLRESGLEVAEWSQRRTYGPIVPAEDNETLDDSKNLIILERLTADLAQLVRTSEGFILVDTFHITQRIRPGKLSDRSLRSVDCELYALGARIVHVNAKAVDLHARLIDGRAGTGFLRYARKFGSTDDELIEYFQFEQARIEGLVRDSCLSSISVTSDRAVSDTAAEIVALLCTDSPKL